VFFVVFVQLTLRKISKIGATRCQILGLKCTKFDFHWGSAPHLAGGAWAPHADLLAVFKGSTSKGRIGGGAMVQLGYLSLR